MTVPFDQEMLERLANARHVTVFTGAGVSQESGIPTFRDALSGLWAQFDPNELATPEAFDRQPDVVWGWYEFRRSQIRNCEPNAAHLAIAQMQEVVPELSVITQNVDDLHERAGSADVVHLHGGLFHNRCRDCARPYDIEVTEQQSAGEALMPPNCPECGGLIRPGVVWFGEGLPNHEWNKAIEHVETCDVLISVGTSSVVFPAAGLPFAAAERGSCVIQVNPDPTDLDAVANYNLHGKAGEVMPALLDAIIAIKGHA